MGKRGQHEPLELPLRVSNTSRVVELVQAFLNEQGQSLMWTPLYMPIFQPIELFCVYGKGYVSLDFDKGPKYELQNEIS